MTQSFTLQQIADYLAADLQGDGSCSVYRINTLQEAGDGDISFLANSGYRHLLASTGASAVILGPPDVTGFTGNKLVCDNPYLAYARLSSLFDRAVSCKAGIAATAVVDPSATISPSAHIGHHAVIEAGVTVGQGAVIGPGSFVGENVSIGDEARLHPNVTVYHGVVIGQRVIVHSGAVLGSDGFGFANDRGNWHKIHQLGAVVIGDDTEIGAGTTIDRGAIGNTLIGKGVIIDNQVQIAHNVEVGDHTAIAGCAAIAGSSKVGRHCVLAGGVGLVGHIELCDGVTVTAMSMITKSIDTPGTYSSGTGFSESSSWRRNAARFGQIDRLAKRVASLEKTTNSPNRAK